MKTRTHNSVYSSLIATAVAICLLCSFFLHAVEMTHVHFDNGHRHDSEQSQILSILGEYMHVADKKIFLASALTLMSLWSFLKIMSDIQMRVIIRRDRVGILYEKRNAFANRMYDEARILLRTGIMHSKAF